MKIAGLHVHGTVVETAVEHRERLVVVLALRRIGAGNQALRVGRAVDRVLDDDQLAGRSQGPIARIDDHRAVQAALDVQVGHRPGRAVIQVHARRVDHARDRERRAGRRRPVLPRVDAERVGIEAVRRVPVIVHADGHRVALAHLERRAGQPPVVGPGIEGEAHPEIDLRRFGDGEVEGLAARAAAGLRPAGQRRHRLRRQLAARRSRGGTRQAGARRAEHGHDGDKGR